MKFIAILLAFYSLNVLAKSTSEVSLEGTEFLSTDANTDTSFAADRETGRAWIVLNLTPGNAGKGDDAEISGRNVRVKVQGLALDEATGNIVYHSDGYSTICATPKRRVFKTQMFKSTQNCHIAVTFGTKKIDDGFAMKKEPVVNVQLDFASR